MLAEKAQLTQKYPYRIEMHAHTSPVSTCSQILPSEMIAYYKGLRYHAIVITNHFMRDYLQGDSVEDKIDFYLKDFYDCCAIAEKEGLKIYLGAELRFTESLNDFLLYGVNRDILIQAYNALSDGVENFYRNIKSEKSLLFQAHPFRNGCSVCPPDILDGIETYNLHPGHNNNIGFATRYAEENGLLKIGGTDFHHHGHAGMIALRTQTLPENSFELAEILKSGDYLLDFGGSIIIP